MDMLFICNVFLVEVVQLDLFLAVGGAEELKKIPLKLVAVVVDVLFGIFAHEKHLSNV